MLKGTNKMEFNELNIKIDSNEVSAQHKHSVIKINPNHKKLLLSKDEGPTHIKEKVKDHDDYRPQFVKVESNLNYLQDDEPSSDNNKSTHHTNVDSFEFVDVNKFTETVSKSENLYASEEIRFQCSECSKTFTKPSLLENHIRVHRGERPFKCSTCHKSFLQSGDLKTHTLIHTSEKLHECDVCHRKFLLKGNLIIHKRSHSDERPFKCAVCDKGFKYSTHLSRHKRIHTGETPYQCHLCEYKCADNLKRHIQSHTGERTYTCKLCKKSFSRSDVLRDHKRRFHNDEDLNQL